MLQRSPRVGHFRPAIPDFASLIRATCCRQRIGAAWLSAKPGALLLPIYHAIRQSFTVRLGQFFLGKSVERPNIRCLFHKFEELLLRRVSMSRAFRLNPGYLLIRADDGATRHSVAARQFDSSWRRSGLIADLSRDPVTGSSLDYVCFRRAKLHSPKRKDRRCRSGSLE